MRAILYSHDGLGLGHVRRNLAIADALTRLESNASVLLVCSTDQIDSLVIPPRVDVLKLPGVRKMTDATYAAKRLPMTEAQTWSMRLPRRQRHSHIHNRPHPPLCRNGVIVDTFRRTTGLRIEGSP